MIGLKIITKKNFEKELKKAIELGGTNSLKKILELKEENRKLADIKDQYEFLKKHLREKDLFLNKSMKNEADLRNAIREVVEKYNVKVPAISIKNEELIKEMNQSFSELFQATMQHISLLNEMSEKADIATITKIQEYCKSLSNE